METISASPKSGILACLEYGSPSVFIFDSDDCTDGALYRFKQMDRYRHVLA